MIVGNGLVARAFENVNHDKLVVFASGVSNSQSKIEEEYQRELDLLSNVVNSNKDKILVYFSTYSVLDPTLKDAHYIRHKLMVEDKLLKTTENVIIVRTSNLVGKTGNPHTLTNFIANHIKSGEVFNVWKNAKRNLLDVDDLVTMTLMVHQSGAKGIFNLVNPESIVMTDLVQLFEKVMKRTANIELVDKTSDFIFDRELSVDLFKKMNRISEEYNERVIHKYYTNY